MRNSARMVGALAFAALAFMASAVGAAPNGNELSTESPADSASDEALRAKLFGDLKAAVSEAEARTAEEAIWRFWMEAPDEETGRLVAAAMDRRSDYDFAGARELLDQAVARSPRYAEAWNQRGFIRFLQEDFDGALADVDRAIELEPKHFAAMAGKAVILMRQGRFRLAQDVLRRAVAIHPFLKERSLILPDPGATPKPAEPKGIDL